MVHEMTEKPVEAARKNYLPTDGIKVLFVAEAPPADPRRFFYFEQVPSHDGLYLAMMRALYEDASDLEASELRHRKPEFLQRFKTDGYYLIDASASPMPPGANGPTKRRLLVESLPSLLETARSLITPETEIVLISGPVYDVCCDPLRSAGLNVVNTEAIDFPGSGRQAHFRRKLGRALDTFLRSTVRGLEKTVDSFGAGADKQKQLDLYVVEHFLRGIGLTFDPAEIDQEDSDPPDAKFRGAEFEVKEILESGRRRGDEYKQQLAKARTATSSDELLEHFSPENISIADVYERIIRSAQALASGKYRVEAVRRSLDLLFYVNLDMKSAWAIDGGSRPTVEPLISQGWRSVSFLHGESTCGVLIASGAAPAFIRDRVGQLIQGHGD